MPPINQIIATTNKTKLRSLRTPDLDRLLLWFHHFSIDFYAHKHTIALAGLTRFVSVSSLPPERNEQMDCCPIFFHLTLRAALKFDHICALSVSPALVRHTSHTRLVHFVLVQLNCTITALGFENTINIDSALSVR